MQRNIIKSDAILANSSLVQQGPSAKPNRMQSQGIKLGIWISICMPHRKVNCLNMP